MRSTSLSISSTSSQRSISSSAELTPHASPRRGLLSSSSPPSSPSLPSLLYRHGRSPSKSRRGRTPLLWSKRVAFSAFAILLVFFFLLRGFILDYHSSKSINYDLVDQGHLPEEPSAIIIDDSHQHKKWTIWIPHQYAFPLRSWEYAEICAQVEQVQLEMSGGSSLFGKKKGYYDTDPSYVDVPEALRTGLLPSENSTTSNGIKVEDLNSKKVCEKTMTFVMETENAGMGNTLLAMWLTYGLARKEGRAFFVDDTRWPYGKFSTYFKPPRDPGCRPPPPNHRVPCPRSAAHLIISAATFPYAFGPSFMLAFLDKAKSSHEQQHRIYELMRSGYEALFHLAEEGDAAYVEDRITSDIFQSAQEGGGMTVGLHIRRGDVHPWEREFEGDYLPVTRYMDEVRGILIAAYEHDDESEVESDEHPDSSGAQTYRHQQKQKSKFSFLSAFTNFVKPKNKYIASSSIFSTHDTFRLRKRHGPAGMMASKLLFASDDPAVYAAPEVSRGVRAQDRILLATKGDLEHMAGAGHRKGPLDSIHGWEGGFYSSQFFSMGVGDARTATPPGRPQLRGRSVESDAHERFTRALMEASASLPAHDPWHGSHLPMPPPSEQALALRAIVGRGYLLDMAVLGQADAVVCAVSSAACRVLGVMLGWDKVVGGGWINVDGRFGWRGLVVE